MLKYNNFTTLPVAGLQSVKRYSDSYMYDEIDRILKEEAGT
jgi:hypothetical protein